MDIQDSEIIHPRAEASRAIGVKTIGVIDIKLDLLLTASYRLKSSTVRLLDRHANAAAEITAPSGEIKRWEEVFGNSCPTDSDVMLESRRHVFLFGSRVVIASPCLNRIEADRDFGTELYDEDADYPLWLGGTELKDSRIVLFFGYTEREELLTKVWITSPDLGTTYFRHDLKSCCAWLFCNWWKGVVFIYSNPHNIERSLVYADLESAKWNPVKICDLTSSHGCVVAERQERKLEILLPSRTSYLNDFKLTASVSENGDIESECETTHFSSWDYQEIIREQETSIESRCQLANGVRLKLIPREGNLHQAIVLHWSYPYNEENRLYFRYVPLSKRCACLIEDQSNPDRFFMIMREGDASIIECQVRISDATLLDMTSKVVSENLKEDLPKYKDALPVDIYTVCEFYSTELVI